MKQAKYHFLALEAHKVSTTLTFKWSALVKAVVDILQEKKDDGTPLCGFVVSSPDEYAAEMALMLRAFFRHAAQGQMRRAIEARCKTESVGSEGDTASPPLADTNVKPQSAEAVPLEGVKPPPRGAA